MLSLSLLLLSSASSFGTHNNNMLFGQGNTQRRLAVRGGSESSSRLQAASVTPEAAISTENLALLSERGRSALENLIKFDQADKSQRHVYADWPEPGTDDEGKQRLSEQVSGLSDSLFTAILVQLLRN